MTIEISVKHLSQKTYQIKIDEEATVGDLKKEIEKESEVKAEEIKLIFKGKILKKDDDKLTDHKIENGSAIHMVHNKPQQTQN